MDGPWASPAPQQTRPWRLHFPKVPGWKVTMSTAGNQGPIIGTCAACAPFPDSDRTAS
jgi:hypothetical protein